MVAPVAKFQPPPDDLPPQAEALLARLTRAAYDVALRHRPDRPFTELELSLWRELRAVFQLAGDAQEPA